MGKRLHHPGSVGYWRKKAIESDNRIRELERQIAETKQYLAVAEGQANGGPPGWAPKPKDPNHWQRHTGHIMLGVFRLAVGDTWSWYLRKKRRNGDGYDDHAQIGRNSWGGCREAIAAAETAYQEAIASHGEQ